MTYTSADLAEILRQLTTKGKAVDVGDLRYVIYVRRSTDEKDKQVRSLADQIIECQEFATRKGLKIIGKPIEESESAKEPDIRPKFRQMLEDIKKGKYDGIIAWHPDRLARNMRDAGELIDLLDKEIIKDLQFVSFTFENTTSGKMLLGIAFVLSKQFSDKLSDDVKRGMRRSIEEGKWLNRPKHGYYKDRNKLLRPDGDYYSLIKSAWGMRFENKRLEDIANYLNENNYKVPDGIGNEAHKPYKIDNKRVSDLFRDPFYAGVQQYGDTVVDLTTLYDFTPMISVDDFLKINRISDIKKVLLQRYRADSVNIEADLLRKKVICGYCNEPMITGITPKPTKARIIRYFYYRCDTKYPRKCRFYGKSLRAHVVVNYAKDYLSHHKFTSRGVYDHYVVEMRRVNEIKRDELLAKKRGLQTESNKYERDIEKTKELLLNETDPFIIKDTFKGDLKVKVDKLQSILSAIDGTKAEIDKCDRAVLSYERFIELFGNLPDMITKTKTLKAKDFILGKIFLNFTIIDKKVASYQLNPPFDRFAKEGKIVSSRGRQI